MSVLTEIAEVVQTGNKQAVVDLARKGLDEGISAQSILNDGLLKGMDVIGARFIDGDVFVPEVVMVANALNAALDVLRDALVEAGVEPIAKVVIFTVEGDQHDIGKNIVKTLLEANFFTVFDLGRDCPAEKALEKAKEVGADVIMASALMTTTMPAQRKLIEYLKEEGVRDDYIVIYGGAPVTQQWCDDIGADGYGDTAADSVTLVKKILAKKK